MRCKSTPLTASLGAELGLCGLWGQKEAASPPAGLGRASFSCCCGCGAGGSWAVPRCPAQLRASGRGVLLAVTAPGRSGSWSLQALPAAPCRVALLSPCLPCALTGTALAVSRGEQPCSAARFPCSCRDPKFSARFPPPWRPPPPQQLQPAAASPPPVAA